MPQYLAIDIGGTGYYNSGATAGRSAAQVAFRWLVASDLLPINEGILEPLTTILPPGKIVSAERRAAMHLWMTVPMTIVDLVFRALSDVLPHEVAAGHHADLRPPRSTAITTTIERSCSPRACPAEAGAPRAPRTV